MTTERPPPRKMENFLQRVGQSDRPWKDLYAYLLLASWPKVVLLSALTYLSLNLVFALLYWIVPGSVANSDGSYIYCFFFSVQTFGSIGYGAMYSQGIWANTVVVVEAFTSVFCIATLTGIVFSKFARPHARVLYSRAAVVQMRNGVPTLSFRVANERGNDVVEASISVNALQTMVTAEGQQLRRFAPLKLERDSSPVFILSWQIFHPITPDSPLYGLSPEQLIAADTRIVISLTGLDSTFSQTIHARHAYWADDLMFGERFVDVIENLPGGVSRMDFRKFHETVPDPAWQK